MQISTVRLRLAIAALMVVSFLGAIEHTIVATSLATVAGELNGLEQMSWIVVGYTVASTVVLPVLGKLGDLLGARGVFLVSLGLFIVASAVCGFAQDMTQLVVARVAQGAASAGMNLMSQTIVAEITTPRQRPHYLSIVGATFPIAILIGPAAGGIITDAWGWRWVFWINVPVGIAALLLATLAIPRLPGTRAGRFDLFGTLLIGLFITASVFAATWIGTGQIDLLTPTIVVSVVAVVALLGFIAVERRAPAPLVPLRHFSRRAFAISTLLGLIIGVGLFSVVSYVPTYVQMVYGTSPRVSGLVPISMVFGMLAATLTTGWLASRTGHYRAFPIVGSLLSAIGLAVMVALPVGAPLWAPIIAMGIVGIGTGSFMNIITAVAQSAVPRAEVGSATATTTLVRQIGSSVGTAVVGSLLGAGVAAALPDFDAASLTPQFVHDASAAVQGEVSAAFAGVMGPIFTALAVLNLVGLVLAVLLPRDRLKDHEIDDDLAPESIGPLSQLETGELAHATFREEER